MSKVSGFTLRVQREKLKATNDVRYFTIQQSLDILLITAHDEFGFGKERLQKLRDAYCGTFSDYSHIVLEDDRVDKELAYTKDRLDRKLKEILGDDFVPWEERYK